MAGMLLLGSRPSIQQTVVNAGANSLAFLNLAHGIALASTQVGWPGVLTSDGYPSGTTTAVITSNNFPMVPTYIGRYKHWWVGTGNFEYVGQSAIIYGGGGSVSGLTPTGSGAVTGNTTFGLGTSTQPTSGTPVEFAFGGLISGIADNGSGLVRLTNSNANAFFGKTGSTYQVNNVTNLSPGPYIITVIDSTHIDLQGSAYNGTMAVVGGGAGPQSEAITGASSISWQINTQTFVGWGGMVICRSADAAAILAGQHVNLDYVTAFKAPNLNPRFIRFMDFSAVIGNIASSFTYRPKVSNLSWGVTNQVAEYWGGTVTNGGSDAYTVSNPSASPASGPPVDGEIVSGVMSAANTGYAPTLTISRSGYGSAVPIRNGSAAGLSLTMTGSVPATGSLISWVFTGGGLASPFTYVYGPNSNATNTFTGSSISGTTLTVGAVSAGAVTIGQIITGGTISGAAVQVMQQLTGVANGAGTYKVNRSLSVASATLSGNSPRTVSGNSTVQDTSLLNIAINIRDDMSGNVTVSNGNAQALITAGISSSNPEVSNAHMTFKYNPNINAAGAAALGTGLTITGSDSTTTATYNFGAMNVGGLSANQLNAFTYSGLVQAWLTTGGNSQQGGGPHGGPPLEFYEELCLRANTGMWLNVGGMWTASTIYNTVLHIAQSGVNELAVEYMNETWPGAVGANFVWNMGVSLGLRSSAIHGFTGLADVNMAQQAIAAWAAAGRSRSQLFIVNAYQFVSPSAAVQDRFNGVNLNTSTNVTLAAYGGLGQTAPTVNPSVFPNRPIDVADVVAPAPYWSGSQLNQNFDSTQSGLDTGFPLSAYNPLLVAAYNYANGNSSDKQTALNFLYSGGLSGTGDVYLGTINGSASYNGFQLGAWAHGASGGGADYFGITTTVAGYDSQRAGGGLSVLGVMCYEGDYQAGPANSGDQQGIQASLTTLGDTGGYTSGLPGVVSGSASTVAGDAANIFTLNEAFKNDTRFKDLYTRFFTEFQTAVKSQGNRIALPSTYGFEGSSVWGKYPGSIYSTPYQSWNAIQSFDN